MSRNLEYEGRPAILHFAGSYSNKTPRWEVVDLKTREPIAILTTYAPGAIEMAEDEILVKAWMENERVAKSVLQSGFFEDTGRRVPIGYESAQIWRWLLLE